MRHLPTVLALLALAVSARAQTGSGSLRGVVLPIRLVNIGGFGDWERPLDSLARRLPEKARDTVRVATLTLTPIHTLRPQTQTIAAQGRYGRYDAGRLSMGRYRLRVEAAGCQPYTTEVVILSDSESVQHVALQCAWAEER